MKGRASTVGSRRGDRDVVAVALHVAQQPADVARGQVGLQRPRRVGVAERRHEVRHVAEHHALVGHAPSTQVARRAVDRIAMSPSTFSLRPVAVTTMSASSSRPDASRMPRSVKRSIGSVTTDARPRLIALEQVGVGRDAEALVPRVVARREVGRDVVAGPEAPRRLADQARLHPLRPAPREAEEQHRRSARSSSAHQAVGERVPAGAAAAIRRSRSCAGSETT